MHIKYVIAVDSLLLNGTPTPNAVEELRAATASALATVYPEATVDVGVVPHANGTVLLNVADDKMVRDIVFLTQSVWEIWAAKLTPNDLVTEG